MKFKKIVHISICNNYPLLNKALYIDECLSSGMEVIFLDLSSLTSAKQNFSSELNLVNTEVKTLADLEKYIDLHSKDSIFNIQINYESRWSSIFDVIRAQKITTMRIAYGYYPMPRPSIRRLRQMDLSQALNKLKNKFFERREKFYPDYVFAAGSVAALDFKKSKVVKIDSTEIFEYATANLDLDLPKEGYVAYLDQYTPYHPDSHLTGIVANDPQKFYKYLNEFFKKIEDKYGLPVIIAAHPKAIYSVNPFEERRIIFNSTKNIVFHSNLVLAHFSTAISYAVIYNKPLIFINSVFDSGLDINRFVVAFSEYLHSNSCTLGLDDSLNFEPVVNQTAYQNYKKSFIGWGEESEVNSSNFTEFVSNLAGR